MRDLLSLHVETKTSLAIILIAAIIFLATVFKSMRNFRDFSKNINQYEKIRIQKSP